MKKILFFSFFIFQISAIVAQGEKPDSIVVDSSMIHKKHNAFYFELAGNATLYSLNYERFLVRTKHFLAATRVGLSYLPNGLHLHQTYLAEQNFCIGNETKFVELGVGYTFKRELLAPCGGGIPVMDNTNWGMVRIGGRFMSDERGSIFRIGLLLIFYYKDSCEVDTAHITPYGGISYGFVFGKK
jgi:hypothetical protein